MNLMWKSSVRLPQLPARTVRLSMVKREFVPLAHVRQPQSSIVGWYASVKLDGERAVWIPPSAGMRKEDVPFANKPQTWSARDTGHIATGLWTRNGNIIHAPIDFISQLPPFPVDIELYAGPRSFQFLRSVVSKFEPDAHEWERITACVLDAVDMQQFLQPALIRTRNSIIAITSEAIDWWRKTNCQAVPYQFSFFQRLQWLQAQLSPKLQCVLVPQTRLPNTGMAADEQVDQLFEAVLEDGDEGLILKSPATLYTCARTKLTLKVTPQLTAEGRVLGYYWGREPDNRKSMAGTAYGVRLGAMGGVILQMPNGQTFTLSGTGFAIEDSALFYRENRACAADEGILNPGTEVADTIENPLYPRGSLLTYTYRALTDKGLPVSARFLRRRE